MVLFSPFIRAMDHLRAGFGARTAKARADKDRERGASVVEWVVITTIVVVLAITIGVAITNLLNTKSTDIDNCIGDAGQTNSSNCSGN